MALRAKALAALALVDHVHGLLEGRGPIESMAEHLSHQGSRGGMMPAIPLVNVSEDLLSLL